MTCPSCGAAVPSDARFCPACGHSLEVRVDQRRIATVVFADLVGFTSLSEGRDPEHVKNLVDRCFERLAADVTAFGGKVDKVVGDALVALFGAPLAHEDDAERAVRAALQMHRTVETLTEETGLDVRMRVGVNTGEVLVGGIRAGDEYTAMGDVVNVASRLQTAAEPGQVVVGAATREATRDVVRYEALGSLDVKGRDETVDAWVATAVLAPPGYRPRRVRTPFVGRSNELGLLRHALDGAVRHRRPLLVLLFGEAGMGKSRLAEELAFSAQRDHGATLVVGRCVPYGEANPWWPISEILRQAFGIELSDSVDATLQKIRRGVEAIVPSGGSDVDRWVDGLLYLMGVEDALGDVDPSRAIDEAMGAISRVIESLAAQRLLVVFLADLHWADEQVLDVVDRLLERLRGLPVVLVGTARPELDDRWSPESGRHNSIVLHLDPLDEEAVGELLDALVDDAPPELRAELLQRAGGNPFFVEELVALLGETGALQAGDGAYEVAASGELPSSLRGIVAARLDGVGVRQRSMVEDAAVIGRVGPVSALIELGETRGEREVARLLDELIERELLVVDDGRFEFKSDLVREVAYETLTKSERARRHASVANWLEERARRTGREDEHVEQIAHHHSVAAELVGELGAVDGVPVETRTRALEWLERAAERARERDSLLVAEQFYDDALGLLSGAEDDHRRQLLVGRAKARVGRHDLPGAKADVAEVLEKATAAGDRILEARALSIRGEAEQREGDVDAALATLEQAMTLANEVGDRAVLAEAIRHWGMAQLFRGELEQAEHAIAEAREIFRELADRRNEAWALQNLAWIAFSGGDSQLADERLSEAAAMFEDLSDWGGRGWALGLLGFVRLTQGRLEEAGELADTVIPDARRGGDRWGLGITLVLRASVALWLGDTRAAREAAVEAEKVFNAIGDTYGRSLAVGTLARANVSLGRVAEANAAVEEANTLFDHQGDAMRFMGATLATNVRCQLGDARGALSSSAEADLDAPDLPTETLVARALALVQAGRSEEALPYLDRVIEDPGSNTGPGDEGARTYALAVRSLAETALGDPDAAIELGQQVPERQRGTYLDEAYAAIAVGLAHVQRGNHVSAREVLDRMCTKVDATGDRLTQAIVRLARARALEAMGHSLAGAALAEAKERFEAIAIDPYGWETAFGAALSGGVSAAANP